MLTTRLKPGGVNTFLWNIKVDLCTIVGYYITTEAKHELTEGNKVEVLVNKFDDRKIIVSIIVDGLIQNSRLIGLRGGLTVL